MKISLLGLPCLTVLVFVDMGARFIRMLAYNVYCKAVNSAIIAPKTALFCAAILWIQAVLRVLALSNFEGCGGRFP
jgi:hypothetical protein